MTAAKGADIRTLWTPKGAVWAHPISAPCKRAIRPHRVRNDAPHDARVTHRTPKQGFAERHRPRAVRFTTEKRQGEKTAGVGCPCCSFLAALVLEPASSESVRPAPAPPHEKETE